jgi:hypothetical protein
MMMETDDVHCNVYAIAQNSIIQSSLFLNADPWYNFDFNRLMENTRFTAASASTTA